MGGADSFQGRRKMTATVNFYKTVQGVLVNKKQWSALTADQLREAISNGDLLVVQQKNGTFVATPALEIYDNIEHAADYFRPSGRF
jgi:hypothetical protein